MKTSVLNIAAVLLIITQIQLAFSLESSVPAFLWSSHMTEKPREAVNYQTISQKDLARSVLAEGGWSNVLCGHRDAGQPPLDVAFVFVGKELQSLDIAGRMGSDKSLVDSLKTPFSRANFSMAFPYVTFTKEDESMESSLLSEFSAACGHDSGVDNIVLIGSCMVEDKGYKKLADSGAIQDYLSAKRENGAKGKTDLVMYCHEDIDALSGADLEHSESDVFSKVISFLEQFGARYAFLYASDPYNFLKYPTTHEVERFLAEAAGNGSANSTTCDAVCQLKTSLLEGLFVGITLLIILISGLCCMMGIDTPTRFEAPQE